ncbi:MAG: helix-turn-helix transcriptional regulator [Alphaproteobacteria bacterium]
MNEAIRKKKPNEIDMCVSANLAKLRVAKSLTQAQVAESLDISIFQLQKYESGKNRVSASRLYVLAHILGCKLEDFFEGIRIIEEFSTPEEK